MSCFAFYGLRGGSGVTSIVAALGYALHGYGQQVLLVDLSGEAMLGLHFNCPVSSLYAADEQMLWEVIPGLQVLSLNSFQSEKPAELNPQLLDKIMGSGRYDRIIFDVASPEQAERLAEQIAGLRPVVVVKVDSAAHIRLHREYDGHLLLVNGYVPESRLQSDLLMLWQHQPDLNLLPLVLHQDEAWNEALACKQPVGLARPHSQAASEANSLAVWCMAQKGVT